MSDARLARSLCLVLILGWPGSGPVGTARAAAPEACPFVGHNTYAHQGHDRLAAALTAGIPGIEIDVSWGVVRRRAVVTHNKVTTGLGLPELGETLEPVWPRWASISAERMLMIDLKSGGDGVARRLHEVLAPHAALLSRMQPGGAFRRGRVTVYLSGSADAQAAYERHARAKGEYLAFGCHAREKEDWRPDAAAYAPAEPPGWRRYLNMDIRCFMRRRQDGDADFTQLSGERLAAAAAACGTAGYPIRVWTVNARRAGTVDTAAWRACVDAGIPMVATDDYELAMRFWEGAGTSGRR